MSWLDPFLQAYNAIRNNGTPVPARQVIEFTGSATVTDDPNSTPPKTIVAIATPGGFSPPGSYALALESTGPGTADWRPRGPTLVPTGTPSDAGLFTTAFAAADEVWLAPGSFKFAADHTLGGAGQTIRFMRGAELLPAAGVKVTYDADGVQADDDQQIFNTSAGGSVVFGYGFNLVVKAGWFGVVGVRGANPLDPSNDVDSTAAFQAAIDAIAAAGGYHILQLPPGRIRVDACTIDSVTGLRIEGAGDGSTRFIAPNTGDQFTLTNIENLVFTRFKNDIAGPSDVKTSGAYFKLIGGACRHVRFEDHEMHRPYQGIVTERDNSGGKPALIRCVRQIVYPGASEDGAETEDATWHSVWWWKHAVEVAMLQCGADIGSRVSFEPGGGVCLLDSGLDTFSATDCDNGQVGSTDPATGGCCWRTVHSADVATVSAVNTSTGLITTSSAHGFVANTVVRFSNQAGAVPTGLDSFAVYYVIASGLTSTDFKVSTTLGGSAVVPSDSGTGTTTVWDEVVSFPPRWITMHSCRAEAALSHAGFRFDAGTQITLTGPYCATSLFGIEINGGTGIKIYGGELTEIIQHGIYVTCVKDLYLDRISVMNVSAQTNLTYDTIAFAAVTSTAVLNVNIDHCPLGDVETNSQSNIAAYGVAVIAPTDVAEVHWKYSTSEIGPGVQTPCFPTSLGQLENTGVLGLGAFEVARDGGSGVVYVGGKSTNLKAAAVTDFHVRLGGSYGYDGTDILETTATSFKLHFSGSDVFTIGVTGNIGVGGLPAVSNGGSGVRYFGGTGASSGVTDAIMMGDTTARLTVNGVDIATAYSTAFVSAKTIGCPALGMALRGNNALTSDQNLTSTSYANLVVQSLTLPDGIDARIDFSACVTTLVHGATLRLTVDGTEVPGTSMAVGSAVGPVGLSLSRIVTGLSAGAHTFAVEYKVPSGGTLQVLAGTTDSGNHASLVVAGT